MFSAKRGHGGYLALNALYHLSAPERWRTETDTVPVTISRSAQYRSAVVWSLAERTHREGQIILLPILSRLCAFSLGPTMGSGRPAGTRHDLHTRSLHYHAGWPKRRGPPLYQPYLRYLATTLCSPQPAADGWERKDGRDKEITGTFMMCRGGGG